jgi:hypothetical protein
MAISPLAAGELAPSPDNAPRKTAAKAWERSTKENRQATSLRPAQQGGGQDAIDDQVGVRDGDDRLSESPTRFAPLR